MFDSLILFASFVQPGFTEFWATEKPCEICSAQYNVTSKNLQGFFSPLPHYFFVSCKPFLPPSPLPIHQPTYLYTLPTFNFLLSLPVALSAWKWYGAGWQGRPIYRMGNLQGLARDASFSPLVFPIIFHPSLHLAVPISSHIPVQILPTNSAVCLR